jgi:UDP-N-acetylglucosamine:LPS N-acetylglucosamine transferase
VLARWAERICVAYPGMEAFFPADKIRLTGNPVRSDIQFADQQVAAAQIFFGLEPNRPTLLVIGGSQGARTLNESMEKGLKAICRCRHSGDLANGACVHRAGSDGHRCRGLATPEGV